MFRINLAYILFSLLVPFSGQPQTPGNPANSDYSYYHPSKDKESWQRLNLLLSSTFIVVAKEGQVEHDTCLYIASRSLGLSRLPVLAEGIEDKDLLEQSQWVDQQQPDIGMHLLSSTTGRKRLQLLVLLGAYYAFQPNSYDRYKDSVEYFLSKALNESRSLKEDRLGRQAFCLLGKIYVQANDKTGDSIFNLVINQSREAGDKETEARAVAYRGIYTAPSQTSFRQKVADLQAASVLYHSLANSEGEINILMDLGYMLVVSGQFMPAQESFLKALELAEFIHYPYIHYISDALANITSFQGKFGDPLRYTFQTIKVAENCRDRIGLPYFYSRLSDLYDTEGRQKESVDMAQKAVKRFVSDHNPSVYAILTRVVGDMCEKGQAAKALVLIHDISKNVDNMSTLTDMFAYNAALTLCYLELNVDSAELHIKKMDSLETKAEIIRGPLRRTMITDMYGHVFFRRGQYQKAREYFEKHFTTPAYIQHSLSNDLHMCRWLIITDSVLRDNAAAVADYKKYTALLDSNFKVTKIRQAEELQVIYETQEKEKQIASLNQQTALEKANAKQATLVKNLTLAGIAGVIIIAGLLYRQNQLKQRNNKIITHKNEELQDLLTEKEWLVKEIHHRVKNNLQIVMSLLNSQSVYINNDAALTAIHDSRRRVYAMSLIHQKLYQSENISAIAMKDYVSELVSYVEDSFSTGNRITFNQYIEPLNLDVSQAIPLGLIINESIVNAIKYAFPGGRKGIVSISLQHDDDNHLLLDISDNGIGLPAGLDAMKHNSLGLNLVRGLAKQLNGDLIITGNNGLAIKIRFSFMSKQMAGEILITS